MLGLLSLLGDSEPLSFRPAGTHSRFGLHAGEEHREGLGQSPRIVASCVVTALLGSGAGRRITFCGGASLSGGHQSLAQSGQRESQALGPRCGRSWLRPLFQAAARRRITIKSVFFVCGREREVASGPNPRHRELETSPSPNLSLSPKGTSQEFFLGDSRKKQRGVANGGGKVVFGKFLAICGVEMESADT